MILIAGTMRLEPANVRRSALERRLRRRNPVPEGGPGGSRRGPSDSLQLGDTRARAVLVLLGRAAADAAGAFHHAAANDGHRALARDHMSSLGRGDTLDDRTSRPLG